VIENVGLTPRSVTEALDEEVKKRTHSLACDADPADRLRKGALQPPRHEMHQRYARRCGLPCCTAFEVDVIFQRRIEGVSDEFYPSNQLGISELCEFFRASCALGILVLGAFRFPCVNRGEVDRSHIVFLLGCISHSRPRQPCSVLARPGSFDPATARSRSDRVVDLVGHHRHRNLCPADLVLHARNCRLKSIRRRSIGWPWEDTSKLIPERSERFAVPHGEDDKVGAGYDL
jgi:hypothetical protein